jgi:nicotinamide phosphoribosyltransferase
MSTKRFVRRHLQTLMEKNADSISTEVMSAIEKLLKNPHNLILLTDAYKYSHHSFYGETMSEMGSYLEARGGMFGYNIFKGIQPKIKKYLSGVAFTKHDVDEAYELLGTELGVFGRDDVFDRTKFDYIVDTYGGRLPVEIKAVPEGTPVNHHNALLYIEALDEKCAWLTNFLESLILQIWYPITVATLSREVKKVVIKAFEKTSDLSGPALDFTINLVLNDFGFRGVSSVESAEIGGAAHLVNFDGSDNVIASKYIMDYYGTNKVYGKSVPATEHSIMTLKGKMGELEMMKRVLTAYPTGVVACVSDTYDIMDAVDNKWGKELKDLILSRPAEPGNCLVIRPDSGHVLVTLKKIFESLFKNFGYTTNSKGCKVLPPQVRVIQGDGVNYDSIVEIYKMFEEEKISAENLVLGMGGKLLQADIDRDKHNFATKACHAVVDGVTFAPVKSPIVFDKDGNRHESFKKSKEGKPKLVNNGDGTFRTVTSIHPEYFKVVDCMQIIFRNGEMYNETTFDEVRERAKIPQEELVS